MRKWKGGGGSGNAALATGADFREEGKLMSAQGEAGESTNLSGLGKNVDNKNFLIKQNWSMHVT